MISNFKGNDRYYLEDNFGDVEEVNRSSIKLVEFEDTDYVGERFYNFLVESCSEDLTYEEFIDMFGLAYISCKGYGILTLDTNAWLFIDEEYYMSYLVMDEVMGVYVVCSSIEDEDKRYFRIV